MQICFLRIFNLWKKNGKGKKSTSQRKKCMEGKGGKYIEKENILASGGKVEWKRKRGKTYWKLKMSQIIKPVSNFIKTSKFSDQGSQWIDEFLCLHLREKSKGVFGNHFPSFLINAIDNRNNIASNWPMCRSRRP